MIVQLRQPWEETYLYQAATSLSSRLRIAVVRVSPVTLHYADGGVTGVPPPGRKNAEASNILFYEKY